jgi:glycosyltransferase involved in cell wall biosynthesis
MKAVRPAEERGIMRVLIIARGFGFPNGFAATQRLRLEARALAEAGVRVRVLLTSVSELPADVVNQLPEGEWQGIPFKYSTGTTVRSGCFMARRWTELKGIAGAIASIVSGRRTGDLDCVYLWMNYRKWVPFGMLRGLCVLLGVPVVCELNEPSRAVWEGAPLSQGAGSRDRLLAHMDGFIAISGGLEDWVRTRKGGARPEILRLPVLVDTDEVEPSSVRAVRDDVFYAAAAGYLDEIEFVLDAIDLVREQCPDVRIRFSGWQITEVARIALRDRLRECVASGTAIVEGAMTRERLLESYRECAALLLPMKDEPRSLARCPTKLGEYMASGRPVVATGIGELGALLSEGHNAFLAEPGDIRSFADAVVRALGDPERAVSVGRGGRVLAEQVLDYRRYPEALHEFFAAVCAKHPRGRGRESVL